MKLYGRTDEHVGGREWVFMCVGGWVGGTGSERVRGTRRAYRTSVGVHVTSLIWWQRRETVISERPTMVSNSDWQARFPTCCIYYIHVQMNDIGHFHFGQFARHSHTFPSNRLKARFKCWTVLGLPFYSLQWPPLLLPLYSVPLALEPPGCCSKAIVNWLLVKLLDQDHCIF